VARVGLVACRMLAADQLGGAGISAGSIITRALRPHHTQPPTRGATSRPTRSAAGLGGKRWCRWPGVV